jgi:hypothetical protein
MSGLIRGKRLVWEHNNHLFYATTAFGVYQTYQIVSGLLHGQWAAVLSDGTYGHHETLELAQAHCQADHDKRALSTVEVAPLVFEGATYEIAASAGAAGVDIFAYGSHWKWLVTLDDNDGKCPSRDEAITAANQFVTRLVMGDGT